MHIYKHCLYKMTSVLTFENFYTVEKDVTDTDEGVGGVKEEEGGVGGVGGGMEGWNSEKVRPILNLLN